MKDRVYLRVAKDGSKFKAAASSKPIREPLSKGTYNNKRFLPTLLIGLDLTIPDIEFEDTRIILEANVERAEPAVEVRQVRPEQVEEEEYQNGP